ncbi:MAG: hypothetical protein AAF962_18915 [Actinomycetota bacterium]
MTTSTTPSDGHDPLDEFDPGTDLTYLVEVTDRRGLLVGVLLGCVDRLDALPTLWHPRYRDSPRPNTPWWETTPIDTGHTSQADAIKALLVHHQQTIKTELEDRP